MSYQETERRVRLWQRDLANQEPRLAVSQQTAAQMIDVCVDTIENMVKRGELERVRLTSRKYGITYRSLMKLIDGKAA